MKKKLKLSKEGKSRVKKGNKDRFYYQSLWNKMRSLPKKEKKDAASGHAEKDD
jgi:hypothetical protein